MKSVKKIWEIVSLSILLLILVGCSTLIRHETYSSFDYDLTQKSGEDMIVISHYSKQVFYSNILAEELRIVLLKDGQSQVIRLVDPTTGKAITGDNPQWSPDGKTIGFVHVSAHGGFITPGRKEWQPGIVRYDGTGLSLFPKKYSVPGASIKWSANGSKLFVCAPTNDSGSLAGTTAPSHFEFDIYDRATNRLESSTPIKGHTKIKLEPTISPSGVRLAYTDQEERLNLVELSTKKEMDLTSEIRDLAPKGTETFQINDLNWVNDEQLLIAMEDMLIIYDCKAFDRRTVFTSSTKIVRVKYLEHRKQLLVGYTWEKGTDIAHLIGFQATGFPVSADTLTQQGLSSLSTNPELIISLIPAATTALITLPWDIKDTKYVDTAFALVELDGRFCRPFCAIRSYRMGEPAHINNVSSKGRFVTFGVDERGQFIHLLDLETGNVYRAVGY
ncbi:MAG TPA: TolB family protein [Candidatus Hypogeohydataceae bacterium YC41]